MQLKTLAQSIALLSSITITVPDALDQRVVIGFDCQDSPTPRACVKQRIIEFMVETITAVEKNKAANTARQDAEQKARDEVVGIQ
jgi:hypothetical protein